MGQENGLEMMGITMKGSGNEISKRDQEHLSIRIRISIKDTLKKGRKMDVEAILFLMGEKCKVFGKMMFSKVENNIQLRVK